MKKQFVLLFVPLMLFCYSAMGAAERLALDVVDDAADVHREAWKISEQLASVKDLSPLVRRLEKRGKELQFQLMGYVYVSLVNEELAQAKVQFSNSLSRYRGFCENYDRFLGGIRRALKIAVVKNPSLAKAVDLSRLKQAYARFESDHKELRGKLG